MYNKKMKTENKYYQKKFGLKMLNIFSILFLSLALSCNAPTPDYEDSVFKLSFSPETSEAAVVQLIEDAEESIYVALYGFSNEPIENALVEAYKMRGIKIKMVTEYDSEKESSWQRMIKEGIPVVLRNKSGIMHNKYFIVDGKYVVTGSTNLTEGMFRHFNNLIIIKSPSLAVDFKMDFDVLYAGYSANSKDSVGIDNGFDIVIGGGFDIQWPETTHKINNYEINAYFTPYNKGSFPSYKYTTGVDYSYFNYDTNTPATTNYKHALNIIIPLLKNAKKSIYILTFAFTDKVIANELIIASVVRGLDVRLYMDYMMFASQFRFSGGTYLALGEKLGKDKARICKQQSGNALLHHKVIMIDDDILILGSLNFSASAVNDNDENFLVIKNAEGLIGAFQQEMKRVDAESHSIPEGVVIKDQEEDPIYVE